MNHSERSEQAMAVYRSFPSYEYDDVRVQAAIAAYLGGDIVYVIDRNIASNITEGSFLPHCVNTSLLVPLNMRDTK